MRRVFLFSILALICLSVVASAADLTGKWTAQVPGRDGTPREMTFNLKADGDTLTGTVSGRGGDREITQGKIAGDEISFVVAYSAGGNDVKMLYKGKVAGNEVKFTSQREGSDQVREFTAKKAS
jgi:hypothetical protein